MGRRHTIRWFALLLTAFLVAAACSTPDSGPEAEGPLQDEDKRSALDYTLDGEGTESTEEPTDGGGDTGGGGETTAQGTTDGGGGGDGGAEPTNPDQDAEHVQKLGSLIEIKSSEKVDDSWAGVTRDTIKFAFTYDESACGVNTINAISQAGGNFAQGNRWYRPAPTDQGTQNEERREAIQSLIDYWNENAEAFYKPITPQAAPLMDEYNTPGHPFYGRRIEGVLVDGGSYQCPERTTAAAKKIAQEIKPFVVGTNDVPGVDGSGFNMANALHANAPADSRPMHFGSLHLSDKFYRQWAPFNWTQFTSGTASARAHASWICSRLAGKKAEFSPQFQGQDRVWGLAYPNSENGKQVAGEFKGFIQEFCGEQLIDGANEFQFSQDPSRASDEGTQMAIKWQLNGVTSVVYFLDPIAPLFHINVGMKGQDYRPELVWSATGYYDSTTVQRLYDQEWVNGNSIGTSAFGMPGGWNPAAGDPFWAYHATHKVAPNGEPCDPSSNAGMMHSPDYCRAPGEVVTWYYSILPAMGGMVYAGPDLTPHNVTAGLQDYPLTNYGVDGPTDNPHAALVGAGQNQYHFIVDYHAWRWRSSFVSPPPEHKDGYVEFFECQKKYILWPDEVAPGFQNHEDCGGEGFAPPDNHMEAAGQEPVDGHTHDHPHQRDNYPDISHWYE